VTDGRATLCFTPEGVPLSLTSGDRELVLVDLNAVVDDNIFQVPAEPAPPA
jgi:hypothetical protein